MNPMQLISQLMTAKNPMDLMQSLLGNNPLFSRAMEMSQGKTSEQLEQVAMNLCKQRGLDFQQVVQQFQNMGLPIR